MARVTDRHRRLAQEVYMMFELHGRDQLKQSIAEAIADAEERGPQEESSDAQVPSE